MTDSTPADRSSTGGTPGAGTPGAGTPDAGTPRTPGASGPPATSGASDSTITAVDVLADAFTRVLGSVHGVLRGVTQADLAWRIDPEANTIAWLVWHIARGQDAQVSALAQSEQVYTSAGWYDRFGLPFPASASGYGQSAADVAAFDTVGADLLGGYLDAVHARTLEVLAGLDPSELSRVVDDSYDPPVTLAARLVSVVNDCTQHVGQASFVKGSARRARA